VLLFVDPLDDGVDPSETQRFLYGLVIGYAGLLDVLLEKYWPDFLFVGVMLF
jgi:hypothetical protein